MTQYIAAFVLFLLIARKKSIIFAAVVFFGGILLGHASQNALDSIISAHRIQTGVSGGIYAQIAFLCVLEAYPIFRCFLVCLLTVTALFCLFAPHSTVSHSAHLGGLLFGMAAAVRYDEVMKKLR